MSILVNNKKAKYQYEILEVYQAGVKLLGSEVKPARNGKASISEAYCIFKGDELFITGMNISNSDINVGVYAHDTTRDRKLLLNRKELDKIKSDVAIKGLTVVPLKLILIESGLIKLVIGVSRGKKNRDKRQSIKEKDLKREIDRNA